MITARDMVMYKKHKLWTEPYVLYVICMLHAFMLYVTPVCYFLAVTVLNFVFSIPLWIYIWYICVSVYTCAHVYMCVYSTCVCACMCVCCFSALNIYMWSGGLFVSTLHWSGSPLFYIWPLSSFHCSIVFIEWIHHNVLVSVDGPLDCLSLIFFIL